MANKQTTRTKLPINAESPSQRILLEEYRLLQTRYLRTRDEGVTRMNFFITSTSVGLGGVLVLGSSGNVPLSYFKLFLGVALVLLSAIGLDVFMTLIYRDIESDYYERGLARIRHYFTTLDPEVREYFIYNYLDIPTKYITKKSSGMRNAAQVLESVLCGLTTAVLSTFIINAVEVIIVIGVVATVLMFFVFEIYARRKFDLAILDAKKQTKYNENE